MDVFGPATPDQNQMEKPPKPLKIKEFQRFSLCDIRTKKIPHHGPPQFYGDTLRASWEWYIFRFWKPSRTIKSTSHLLPLYGIIRSWFVICEIFQKRSTLFMRHNILFKLGRSWLKARIISLKFILFTLKVSQGFNIYLPYQNRVVKPSFGFKYIFLDSFCRLWVPSH